MGDLVDFKGESGTIGISYDTNIVCCALGRRAWVSVCSVSVFTTKTSGVQHQIQDAFLEKSSSQIPTQLGSASLLFLVWLLSGIWTSPPPWLANGRIRSDGDHSCMEDCSLGSDIGT
jgi:hypothetical protein